MNSPHVTHLITDYLDGTLSAASQERVKSHLVFCNACRLVLNETKENIGVLKGMPVSTPSEDLEKRILAALANRTERVEGKISPSQSWREWLLSFRGLSIAATAVIAVFVLVNVPKIVQETKPSKLKEITTAPAPIKNRDMADHLEPSQPPQILKQEAPTQGMGAPYRELAKSQYSNESASSSDREKPAAGEGLEQKKIARQGLDARSNLLGSEEDLFSGTLSGITRPLEKVVSDQKTWEDLWARHRKPYNNTPPPPPVDFENNEIIALFGGNQPTSGYKIEITRVIQTRWENAPARVIRYKILSPPDNVMMTTILTQPFLFKVVPRAEGPTFFKRIP